MNKIFKKNLKLKKILYKSKGVRAFLLIFMLSAVGLLLVNYSQVVAERNKIKKQPNILFILIDDMGIMDLSLYGEKDSPCR